VRVRMPMSPARPGIDAFVQLRHVLPCLLQETGLSFVESTVALTPAMHIAVRCLS
jgi:hypothetical protein